MGVSTASQSQIGPVSESTDVDASTETAPRSAVDPRSARVDLRWSSLLEALGMGPGLRALIITVLCLGSGLLGGLTAGDGELVARVQLLDGQLGQLRDESVKLGKEVDRHGHELDRLSTESLGAVEERGKLRDEIVEVRRALVRSSQLAAAQQAYLIKSTSLLMDQARIPPDQRPSLPKQMEDAALAADFAATERWLFGGM